MASLAEGVPTASFIGAQAKQAPQSERRKLRLF